MLSSQSASERSKRRRAVGLTGSLIFGASTVAVWAGAELPADPSWSSEIDQVAAIVGFEVGRAGDVNGDGRDDVIVAAPGYRTEGGPNCCQNGAVFVYHGSPGGLSAAADWSSIGPDTLAGYGTGADGAGDVNGDGFDDVVYAANFVEANNTIFVHRGSTAGLSSEPSWTFDFGQTAAVWRIAVGRAGDVNGDGYDDVIAGAPLFDNLETDQGAAFVFHGSADGLSPTPDWLVEGGPAGGTLGLSAATAGDVNGDGYDDVIVASPDEARVYHGSTAGLGSEAMWSAPMVSAGSSSGWCSGQVAAAGDVNADGYDDVIVGAPGWSDGQPAEGAVFVYLGSGVGLETEASWTVVGDQVNALLGCSVAAAGDVNADGVDDIIVGAPRWDGGHTDEGRALIFAGGPSGLSATPVWSGEVDEPFASFGHSVAGAGDIDADGRADVIVGAPLYGAAAYDGGKAFAYYAFASPESGPAGAVADRDEGVRAPLLVAKTAQGDLSLTWSSSCQSSDTDYAVYEGSIGDFTGHGARFCTTDHRAGKTFIPSAGSSYYLVVPLSSDSEGSYGAGVGDTERTPAARPCLAQQIATCE